ncbi:hypothetical protein [Lactobacillus acetotolerans]|jgi:hypothetical protein|uniref:hypothetical protein n=1 Tax=Lactobacillus acetotolerans TaxID=1600 RepID=UPI00241EA0CF|nr:hypothetical protein [Lactobacillus acetotolerans]
MKEKILSLITTIFKKPFSNFIYVILFTIITGIFSIILDEVKNIPIWLLCIMLFVILIMFIIMILDVLKFLTESAETFFKKKRLKNHLFDVITISIFTVWSIVFICSVSITIVDGDNIGFFIHKISNFPILFLSAITIWIYYFCFVWENILKRKDTIFIVETLKSILEAAVVCVGMLKIGNYTLLIIYFTYFATILYPILDMYKYALKKIKEKERQQKKEKLELMHYDIFQ